jgi:hypothetical protein
MTSVQGTSSLVHLDRRVSEDFGYDREEFSETACGLDAMPRYELSMRIGVVTCPECITSLSTAVLHRYAYLMVRMRG